jgi:hypothetical protein
MNVLLEYTQNQIITYIVNSTPILFLLTITACIL